MNYNKEIRQKVFIIGSADVIKPCLIESFETFCCEMDVVHIGKKIKYIHPVDYYSKYVCRYFYVSKENLMQLVKNNCKFFNR